MPPLFPLATVLAIRKQKEAAEERALAAIGAQMQQMQAAIHSVEAEMANHTAMRMREAGATHAAAHHQANQIRWTGLREGLAQLHEQLRGLELKRAEQQARFLSARSDREMLTDLQQGQHAAWQAESQGREAKRMDDLFAARRLRK